MQENDHGSGHEDGSFLRLTPVRGERRRSGRDTSGSVVLQPARPSRGPLPSHADPDHRGQRGLATAGQAGDDNQGIPRQIDIDILEIVGASPPDADGIHHRVSVGLRLTDGQAARLTVRLILYIA